MTHQPLVNLLENIENAKRDNRKKTANIVLQHPELIKELVTITFEVENKLSNRAAWILEWICTHNNINHIVPYLDDFTIKIGTIHFDGVMRCCAKICEQLATAYDSKEQNDIKVSLQDKHIDNIIETGFDWLITDKKIAVKAYTMQTLFSLGKYRDWVHPELKHIIETNVIHQSKGTKARGKKILELIKKHNS